MSEYVSVKLRKLVKRRAHNTCEYCLMHEDDTFFNFQIDHIISLKHGGITIENNLAYACAICNNSKGADLGSFVENPSELIRFYNPRIDEWRKHFKIENAEIIPVTEIGKVTIKIFRLNDKHRIIERERLIDVGDFPSSSALKLIGKSASL